MRNDRERLQDILDSIKQIEKYTVKGFEAFSQDELIQVWFLHHLQIIGEAARSLSATPHRKISRSSLGGNNWAAQCLGP